MALSEAIEVRIAVAFFSPNPEVLDALNSVPDLELVISEEFTLNDPWKLEKLSNANISAVPPSCDQGKLHAKVILAKRPDGSWWGLLGSANLTYQGLFANQEACVVLDTKNGDGQSIDELCDWFRSLRDCSQDVDLELAKQVFAARSQFTMERSATDQQPTQYWVLKTRGNGTVEHWQDFLSRNVIAIGWNKVNLDPAQVSEERLREEIRNKYPGDNLISAVSTGL